MKFETILITGGTGSFGNQITYHLLNHTDTKKVIIYSRDEFKQYKMALKYKHNPRLKFMLGDVRDEKRLVEAMHEVDLVYHAAALKQVPAC
ncbi:polysaccharide biosynthesis protein, partial [Candidatus Micrarchaeota archaeon]|nr:polysaccharide biosynthesis protein [Candidatus Micrarchaeota archaeon]